MTTDFLSHSDTESQQQLALILNSAPAGGFVELRALARAGARGSYWLGLPSKDGAISQAFVWATQRSANGADVYVAPNARCIKQGTKADVLTLTALYVDLDVHKVLDNPREQAIRSLNTAPIRPSLIINSGNGLQAVWIVEPTTDKDSWRRAQRALHESFLEYGSDIAVVSDESRILRLAGFPNRKNGETRPTSIINLTDARSTVAAVLEAFGKTEIQALIATDNRPPSVPAIIGEGSRNATLFSLAGSMRNRGFSEDAIIAAVLIENEQKCQPPLGEREVRALARSVMRYEPDGGSFVEPAKDSSIFHRLGHFMTTAFRASDPIITGLHRGEVGMVQSVPNAGKTTLMLNLAISAACGDEFSPLLASGEPRRVIYFDLENRSAFLQRDLSVMLSGLTREKHKLADENLIVVCDAEIGEETLALSNPAHMRQVMSQVEDAEPDLIIVDTLAEAFDLENENDNAEVKRVVLKPFQELLKQSNAAGLLLHHVGKVSENGDGRKLYRGRGASAIAAKARLILDLSHDAHDEDCVILHCAKIKGERFADTVMRLNRNERWFSATNEKPSPVISPYQRVLQLVVGEMKAGEILVKAIAEGIAGRTAEKALTDGYRRGDLVKVRKGVYARPQYYETKAA